MARIVIVTAVWKRPEIFKMFAQSIHNLGDDIPVIVAGSEGIKSRKMVEAEDFEYLERPNEPLAEKHNAAMKEARRWNPTHVLCLGSDDLISPELWAIYKDIAERRIDYAGVTDFYFYDAQSKKTAYWGGYIDHRKGETAGAGRLLSQRLLNKWNWRPWEKRHSNILDDSMPIKLKQLNHSREIFSLKEKGVFAVDVKSEINMTPFELWPNTDYIPDDEVKAKFPYIYV